MTPKIVLDPGHGGHDPGAVGNGIVEKDWNLAFCLILAKQLEVAGFPTHLTRHADTFLKLSERGDLSRKIGASLVLTVHVNANNDTSVNGLTTFHLPTQPRMDKLGSLICTTAPEAIRRKRVQSIKAVNSPGTDADDWLQRPINTMKSHACDTLLVESFFLTNPHDAHAMRTVDGQTALAGTITSAVQVWAGWNKQG